MRAPFGDRVAGGLYRSIDPLRLSSVCHLPMGAVTSEEAYDQLAGLLLTLEVGMQELGIVLGGIVVLGGAALTSSLRVVKQFERGVVFRLGRVQQPLPRARAYCDRANRGSSA